MQRRLSYLPFLIMVGVAALGLFGCNQSQDILTPISSTEISLSVERLPKPPAGMIYEAWVASSQDTISLGRFGWDPERRRFLDADNNEIPGSFILPHDILKFKTMFISVETVTGDVASSPGPIMLIDNITDPEVNSIILRFPKVDSLWLNNTGFTLEASSDSSRDGHNGFGVWFASYGRVIDSFVDTFSLEFLYDSTPVEMLPGPHRVPDTLLSYDTITRTIPYRANNILLRQGNIDSSLKHRGVNFEFGYFDTVIPEDSTYIYPGPIVRVASADTTLRALIWDFFIGQDWIFPDVSAYGWKYAGWVLTPYLNSAPMTTRWRFTPPVYRYQIGGTNMFPGDTGVLLPTGLFSSTQVPDESDPYSLNTRRAPFPGEDFLNATALRADFGIDSVNILPNATGNIGTIFISLEPINRVKDTTNFPLIVTSAAIPANRTNLNAPVGNRVGTFLMKPLVGTVRGDLYGFPAAYVTITRR